MFIAVSYLHLSFLIVYISTSWKPYLILSFTSKIFRLGESQQSIATSIACKLWYNEFCCSLLLLQLHKGLFISFFYLPVSKMNGNMASFLPFLRNALKYKIYLNNHIFSVHILIRKMYFKVIKVSCSKKKEKKKKKKKYVYP